MTIDRLFFLFSLIVLSSCGDSNDPALCCNCDPINETTTIPGYDLLARLPGIWHGPVSSPTPLGSFPEYIVDFRPIAAAQVSAKNELDDKNDIFMSFFIAQYSCEYKMTFRNGGGFAGLSRVSYMVLDSTENNGNKAYYRFVDAAAGKQRVFTEVIFSSTDNVIIRTFTNKYNTLNQPVKHMEWVAERKVTDNANEAINQFNFPKKQVMRDFTGVFDSLPEALYYDVSQDPYAATTQPHLGKTDVSVSISNPTSPDASKKILLIITTQPLFNGFQFLPQRLDNRSRYVLMPASSSANFTFNSMHPGDYFLNAVYDANGDNNFSSGDYINSSFDIPFSLAAKGNATTSVDISFQIP